MIRFDIRGIRFSLPLLTLLAPILALKLGMETDISALLIALCAHETAHMIAAFIARVNIAEVRIMPFGGSMRMENPYHIRPAKLVFVAIAGPFANIMMLLLISAAAQWGLLGVEKTRALLYPNIILCLFNLIPALPLDGGRIIFALLSRLAGEDEALHICIFLSRLIALALAAAMLAGGIGNGVWNISFLFAAVFIIASEKDERHALASSKMLRIRDAIDGFDMQQAHIYQIDENHSAVQALKLMKPRENAWFIVTKNGCPHSLLDSRSLMKHIVDHPEGDLPLSSLSGFRLCASNDEAIISRRVSHRSR